MNCSQVRSLFRKKSYTFWESFWNMASGLQLGWQHQNGSFCSRRSVDIWMLGARSGMEGWLTEAELRFTWCTLALRERKYPGLHHPKLNQFHVQLERTRFRCNRLVKTFNERNQPFFFWDFWSITCLKLGPGWCEEGCWEVLAKALRNGKPCLGWGKSL